ncbi:MAG: hypothetical protein J3Q66DRAFT_416347 [Benniella sp.]|nr:MAG: hypothetical protein J3Q66DRAFT_416347 [Benniella sp.]
MIRPVGYEHCTYAIFLCGNAGVGKSTLSNALGANFEAGFAFGEGLTKDVSFCVININGDLVLAIDAPGMYEASKERTHQNAKEIQKALGVSLPYKIAFVVASNGGRWLSQDVAIIDKVVESVKASNDSPIEYILIINQIQKDHLEYYMHDPTRKMMVDKLIDATQARPKFSAIACCPHVPDPSHNEMLKTKLLDALMMKEPYKIKVVKDIEADPDDLKVYQKALLILFSPVVAPFLGLYATFSSIKNKIRYDDWSPFR